MIRVGFVFPHQLYLPNPVLSLSRRIYLIEDPLYFFDHQYPVLFHKQKLILHRASMKRYEKEMLRDVQTRYIEFHEIHSYADLFADLVRDGVDRVVCVRVTDDILTRRLMKASQKNCLPIEWLESPNFLLYESDVLRYLPRSSSYFMTSFYIKQRKRLNILINNRGKPVGGKWSFDRENRLPYKSNASSIHQRYRVYDNPYITEATAYVQRYFSRNPGAIGPFCYSTNHDEARRHLETFFSTAFRYFGPYEDAIVKDNHLLFHSQITPSLNIGLLNPQEIVDKALDAANEYNVSISSLEGFIRQIIGWREFMRGVYLQEGVRMRNANMFAHTRYIPRSFWDGTTGIEPIDTTIRYVLERAYCHHIERLMILGNFMLLCEFDPNEVYRWFMSLFIDAYDWVMVPNVYGMSQYVDGGLIITKPYISSSAYILRMSNYCKGEWTQIWDSLFWRFINTHKDILLTNQRMRFMVLQWERMSGEKKKQHISVAESYLSSLV